MDKEIDQIISQIEFDELFEEQVSLRLLIGNENAREIAQNYIDSYYVDLNAGKKPKLSPILLVGSKDSGIHIFARAVSNSFGCLCHHTMAGTWISDGLVNLNSFFGEGNEFSSYTIHGDKFNSTAQIQLFRILTERKILQWDFISKTWEKRDFTNRLIILSVENKEILPNALLKLFQIKLNLSRLTPLEINLALNQRGNLMQLKINPIGLLHQITECSSTIGQAMEILSTAYRISRTKSPDSPIITTVEVNQAIHWLSKNKL